MGAVNKQSLLVIFDSRLKLESHGSNVTSDAGSGEVLNAMLCLRSVESRSGTHQGQEHPEPESRSRRDKKDCWHAEVW